MGDIRPTLEALRQRIKPRDNRSFLDGCLEKVEKPGNCEPTGRGGGIHPQYLAELIDKHADADAIFTADGGTPTVWTLRHVRSTGNRRTLISLTHGTMANAMPHALGAKKAFPDRQVISMSGDGGLAMLMGDLLTIIQEEIPIKVAVFNNSSLGFVEMEMKVEGLLDAYTDLKNPDFSRVAEAIGIRGWRVEKADDLEGGSPNGSPSRDPELLDVVTDRYGTRHAAKVGCGPDIRRGALFGESRDFRPTAGRDGIGEGKS